MTDDKATARHAARIEQTRRWAPRWWIPTAAGVLQLIIKAVQAVASSPITVDYSWGTAAGFLLQYGFLVGVPLFLGGYLLAVHRSAASQER